MRSGKLLFASLAVLAIFGTSLGSAAPKDDKLSDSMRAKRILLKGANGDELDIYENAYLADNNDDGVLLSYDPLANRRVKYENSPVVHENSIKPALNLERETSGGSRHRSLVAASSVSNRKIGGDEEVLHLPNADRFSSIAHNSREIRLVGPNQKEVEMKDDVATKVVVALENLQKEAGEVWEQVNDKLDKGWKDLKRSEVWGQVNEKLDKGWTDLKGMVEGVVSPSSKRQP